MNARGIWKAAVDGYTLSSKRWSRRSFSRRRSRVDVYFDDGSMITYDDGSPQADTLLPIARDALAAARGRL